MRHIVIKEMYDSLKILDSYREEDFYENKAISREEAKLLYNYVKFKGLDTSNIIFDKDSLKFINYVGYIKLKTVSIEILPKVTLNDNINLERQVLLTMLSKCGILKLKYSEISSLKLYRENLNEIFIHLFSKKLEKELSRGIFKEYVYVLDNINSLRGKLRVDGQIKNIALKNKKAFCEFEEFSRDNKLNKILSFFIKEAIKNTKGKETLKTLRKLKRILGDIDYSKITLEDIKAFRFNKLNKSFEESYNLGKMITLGEAPFGERGDNKTYSILFKMNEVFEIYIGKLLGEILNKEDINTNHSKYNLLIKEETKRGVFKLIPDIVIKKDEKEKVIIDTKWKALSSTLNRHGVKREDLYQMYAYLTRYKDVETVILLYPYNENIDKGCGKYLESWHLDEEENKKIRVHLVSLRSYKETLKSLEEIVRQYI